MVSYTYVIYIREVALGFNNFISKFEDNTKTGSASLLEQDKRSLQEDLRELSAWSEKWDILLYMNKCQILHIGSKNRKMDYEISGVKIKSVVSVKDLGVTVTSNLKFSQQ